MHLPGCKTPCSPILKTASKQSQAGAGKTEKAGLRHPIHNLSLHVIFIPTNRNCTLIRFETTRSSVALVLGKGHGGQHSRRAPAPVGRLAEHRRRGTGLGRRSPQSVLGGGRGLG